MAGGREIGDHTPSDFRLLTETVATLMNAGVGSLTQVARDGMRVRASAGASSYR